MANDPSASGRSSRVGKSAITDPSGAAGLLARIRDLNLTLISVTGGGPPA